MLSLADPSLLMEGLALSMIWGFSFPALECSESCHQWM